MNLDEHFRKGHTVYDIMTSSVAEIRCLGGGLPSLSAF